MSRAQPRPSVEHRPAGDQHPALEIHRSPRRRRGAQATAVDGRIVVRVPAGLPNDEEAQVVDRLVAKVLRREARQQRGGDAALAARAHELADAYLDGVRPRSVRWSARMRHRFGSCTPATGDIRISDRIAGHPDHVLDLVLVHELAHLCEDDHGPRFHALLDRYPQRAVAEAFLEGFVAGERAAMQASTAVQAEPPLGPPGSSS